MASVQQFVQKPLDTDFLHFVEMLSSERNPFLRIGGVQADVLMEIAAQLPECGWDEHHNLLLRSAISRIGGLNPVASRSARVVPDLDTGLVGVSHVRL